MLRIWGRKNSVNVQKVLWCAAELGLDFERIDAGGAFGRVRDPDYLAMNPNAMIPTIEDDGFVLWESNAIVRYLAAKHGAGTLCPSDLHARADADRWMDWQQTTIGPPMGPVFMGLIRTPEPDRDLKLIEASRAKAADAWRILDARLKGRDFVLGERLTMADIPLGCMTYRWYALPIERPELPSLKAWYDRLASRPAFQTHAMQPLT